jgi:16S rRNA A1518/A1519 N6-dimethyltransferase RsmA/KsgA/DIM1 with predicted DNA glycosylase/AP lyase activity
LPSAPEVLEVGPGTGQATRDLLARGAVVHAVEIGRRVVFEVTGTMPVEQDVSSY